MEKFCKYLTIILLLVAVVVVILINVKGSSQNSSTPRKHKYENKITQDADVSKRSHSSHSPNIEATRIKSYMNQAADPCDDFYSFACGGFASITRIGKDEPKVTQYSLLQHKVAADLRRVLEEPISSSESEPFALAKIFYKSCMDTQTLERLKFQPLLNVLKEIGGWPVPSGNAWKPSDAYGGWTWTRYAIWLKEEGLNTMPTFMKISIEPDPTNQWDQHITDNICNIFPQIDWPKLQLGANTMRRGFLSPAVFLYRLFMQEMAELMGANKIQTAIQMWDIVEFETNVATCMFNTTNWLEYIFYDDEKTMTIQEMNVRYPSVPWIQFLQSMTGFPETLTNESVITVVHPVYLDCFISLVNSTDPRILANYVGWRAVQASALYLHEDAYNLAFNFMVAVSDHRYELPRWHECVGLTHESMSEAAGAMYVRRYFNDSLIAPAYKMVKDIQNAFLNLLDENDWMSSVTKEEARDKAKLIKINIGYPEEYRDDVKLSSMYEEFNLNANKFYDNIRKLNVGFDNPKLASLRKNISRDGAFNGWEHSPSNSRMHNSIQLPAAVLQSPFFDISRPNYLNFGLMGSSIGHEITHSFDELGKLINKFGNIENWWDRETVTNYNLRRKCMINQYSSFYSNATRMNIKGEQTLSENIADNGGFKQAHRAYKYWVQFHGEEDGLPGLNYTPSQLFWISAAQMWCAVHKSDSLRNDITRAIHSPPEFRVKGSFANNEEFAKDFKCKLGTKMNPVDKCTIW